MAKDTYFEIQFFISICFGYLKLPRWKVSLVYYNSSSGRIVYSKITYIQLRKKFEPAPSFSFPKLLNTFVFWSLSINQASNLSNDGNVIECYTHLNHFKKKTFLGWTNQNWQTNLTSMIDENTCEFYVGSMKCGP